MEIMDQPLFEKLVSHDDFIVKDEFMLYELIKKWTVEKLKEREDYDYFRIWERPDHTPFLLTADGDPYVNLFKNVRISNIIMDRSNLEKLKSDNIIPFDWIEDAGATSLAQMMEISNGTVGSDFKSYRVGIFHSDEATIFVDKIVNYHGIYLRFEFTSGIFTVHRFRHGSETMFHHGTCFLQFRITLYTRKGHKYMKECNKVVVIKRYISENETLNLFQGEGEEIRYKFPTMWDFINVVNTEIGDCRSEFRLPTNKLFPTIIGIDLLYLSGPQKKKQLLEE